MLMFLLIFYFRRKRDEEVVCYGELGCFRDEGPFNYLDMLPSPPAEIGTEFFLFTRYIFFINPGILAVVVTS